LDTRIKKDYLGPAFFCLCLLVLSCAPVRAELTDEEKAQVKKAHDSLYAAEEGLFYTGLLARACSLSPARPEVQAALRAYAQGFSRGHRGLALLVGANPADGAEGAAIAAWPRAQWVAEAFADFDRTIVAFETARSSLMLAQGLAADACSVPAAAVTDSVNRARMWTGWASDGLRQLSRALAYAEPRSAAFPQVVGPHGDWQGTMNLGAFSLRFLTDALGHAAELYDTLELPYPDYNAFYRVALRYVSAQRLIRSTWLNLAMVPLNAAECRKNRFRLVSDSLGRLVSHDSGSHIGVQGAPYEFAVGLGEFQPFFLEQVVSRPLARVRWRMFEQRWADAWRHSDGMAWQVLVFPSDEVLNQIRGQRSEADGPFGPPICQQAGLLEAAGGG